MRGALPNAPVTVRHGTQETGVCPQRLARVPTGVFAGRSGRL